MLAASRTMRSGRSSRSGEPGTRLACGTRLGRPAAVSAATSGVDAFSAARQPESFGLAQLRSGVTSAWPVNQADRAAAKISRPPSLLSAGTGGVVLRSSAVRVEPLADDVPALAVMRRVLRPLRAPSPSTTRSDGGSLIAG